MKKTEKSLFVENLSLELKASKSVVIVNYAGLSVSAQQELKKRLKEVGSKMVVVKNTLLKRAGESAKIDKEALTDTILSGQTALILGSDDPIAPIQVLGKFTKEFTTPNFKVGIVDGQFTDQASLSQISLLPSKDVLLSQLLGSLMSSMYGLVTTLNTPMQNLMYILSSKSGGDQ